MKYFLLLSCLMLCAPAWAQRDPDYDAVVAPQTRLDLRDLGHAPLDVIPDGESGITSLAASPDGNLYGATSGVHSHLFVLNPRHGYVVPLGMIPGTTSVTHSLVASVDGRVFLGTKPGGHLVEYAQPALESPIQIGRTLPVIDHGIPVAGQSIAALALDQDANVIYGLTSPDAHFFRYSITKRQFEDLGVVSKTAPPGEKYEHEKMFSRELIVDKNGNVFMSGQDGVLFKFDVKTGTLNQLAVHAPAVPGREPYTRVDAFALSATGEIFGGTSDGYLFRLVPQTLALTNLGKPLSNHRIAGLAFSAQGKLYGTGGDASDMARLFSYDPVNGAYDLLGFIDVNRPPYFAWQAYEIGDIVTGPDGVIYMGENERISKLFLFRP